MDHTDSVRGEKIEKMESYHLIGCLSRNKVWGILIQRLQLNYSSIENQMPMPSNLIPLECGKVLHGHGF